MSRHANVFIKICRQLGITFNLVERAWLEALLGCRHDECSAAGGVMPKATFSSGHQLALWGSLAIPAHTQRPVPLSLPRVTRGK